MSNDRAGLSRHCYVRLIDKDRNKYVPGFCGNIYKWLPFRHSKAKIVEPDPGEFWPDRKETCTRIQIFQSQFEKLKRKIERDQRNGNLHFQLIKKNCSDYVVELLKDIGVFINNIEYPSEALFRKVGSKINSEKITDVNKDKTPILLKIVNVISTIGRIILAPLYNLGLFLLGATYVEPRIRDKVEKFSLKAFFPFNTNNFKFATGWKITQWQNSIERERGNAIDIKGISKKWYWRLPAEVRREIS